MKRHIAKKDEQNDGTPNLKADENIKKQTKDLHVSFQISQFTCIILTGFVCLAVLTTFTYIIAIKPNLHSLLQYDDYPTEVRLLLKRYDRNDDGYLDIGEFEPIAEKILNLNFTYEYNLPINDTDEVITINTYFEPLLLNTLSKDVNNELMSNPESLKFLKEWKYPNKYRENFGCRDFRFFLPSNDSIEPGEVWYLVKRIEDHHSKQLSSNRYYPSEPNEHEITIYRLLQMFHKRPFLYTRFPPQGLALTLRAKNKEYFDIMFRIHTEFQLNEPPYYPFWFTPGQLTGRLIISRSKSECHIEYFNLYLPTGKKLNTDLEWIVSMEADGGESMEVDIGFTPRMELISSMASNKVMIEDIDPKTGQKANYSLAKYYNKPITHDLYKDQISQIKWDSEIELKIAESNLEKSFYPFKEVPYHPFLDAFSQASLSNKLVHCILLWGVLDDQSC